MHEVKPLSCPDCFQT